MILCSPYRYLDPDAAAFIDAASITDATQTTAINELVKGLKADGLWSGMIAIYPMVGGTASTHKYNLKDPQDTDAAFRLTFSGGWTHASTGALPNGTTGYANTHIDPSSDLTGNDMCFNFYSRTDVVGGVEFGSITTAGSQILQMRIEGALDAAPQLFDCYNTSGGRILGGTAGTSANFHSFSRQSSTSAQIHVNGSQTLNSGTGGGSVPTHDLYLSGRNNIGTADAFDAKECAFASIGDGLTPTEVSNLYTRVTTYNTTLSRNN